jgi:hypothetical protein
MRFVHAFAVAALALLTCSSSARAIGTLPDDTVWGPMRGSSTLCFNYSLHTVNPPPARARLKRASVYFHKADELALTQNYLGSFAKAKSALATLWAGRKTMEVFQVFFSTGTTVANAARLVLQCAIQEVSAAHPTEAAQAQALFDEAELKRQDGNFPYAVKLYRKAYGKIAPFVVLS